MTVSQEIQAAFKGSSLIRKMFEQGNILKQKYGADQVFDLSLGNPVFEPPKEVTETLILLLKENKPGMHRYMPNAGYPETRAYVAKELSEESGVEFSFEDILMTVGAGGGLNVIFKTILNPGDEVISLTPYFVEYNSYVKNAAGKLILVETDKDFRPDLELLEKAITPKTKALIINSPNNPTGVIYTESELQQIGELLAKKSKEIGLNILLISDEPYKKIIFDEAKVPSVFNYYSNTLSVYSHSKDLALPGERIGYIAVSPKIEEREILREGLALSLRTLGFVNAPALMQRMLPLIGKAMVDMSAYQKNRDLLYNHLKELGFEVVKPEGAFYLFPKCPIEDDMKFADEAQKLNLLVVPGRAFGKSGFFRISFCFETDLIERSLEAFTRLASKFNLKD